MLEYDFSIEYKKGKENKATNALPRQHEVIKEVSLVSITVLDSMWLQNLKASYKTDMDISELYQKLQQGQFPNKGFTLVNVMLLKREEFISMTPLWGVC